MKCIELNSKGNYDSWYYTKIEELSEMQTSENFNEYGIYQNKHVRIGAILLEPYERTPFRTIKNNFKLICLTGGVAISRFSDGGISLLVFDKGECVSQKVGETPMVNDLQNIGDNQMIMVLIEYKPKYSKDNAPSKVLEVEEPVFC